MSDAIRQQIRKLFWRDNNRDPLQSRLRVTDENADPLAPTEVEDERDVRGAFIELDGNEIHVRRIFGRWKCLSCDESEDCDHASRVVEVVEEWARVNERRTK